MNMHRFLWSVKGNLPAWAILAPLVAGALAFALGPFVQTSLSIFLNVTMFAPLAACLILAYTYWAIAIPLLYCSYLGLLFPEFHPLIAPFALPLGISGCVALALGIQSEWKHGNEKKTEVLTRYGISKLPWRLCVVCGALYAIGVVVNVPMDTIDAEGLVTMTTASVVLSTYGFCMRQREKVRPNQRLRATEQSAPGAD